jgi:hypothetical protein
LRFSVLVFSDQLVPVTSYGKVIDDCAERTLEASHFHIAASELRCTLTLATKTIIQAGTNCVLFETCVQHNIVVSRRLCKPDFWVLFAERRLPFERSTWRLRWSHVGRLDCTVVATRIYKTVPNCEIRRLCNRLHFVNSCRELLVLRVFEPSCCTTKVRVETLKIREYEFLAKIIEPFVVCKYLDARTRERTGLG